MAINKLTLILSFALAALTFTLAQAQYDDVYFDPNRDAPSTYSKGSRYSRSNDAFTAPSSSTTGNRYNYTYDDSSYDFGSPAAADDNEYDYYYTSRIRRFNRPLYGFNYFDPYYVDLYYYDPVFTPGATVLIYDNFYSYSAFNSWRRWNRWNRFNTFATWGWQPYTPFYRAWGWNRVNNWDWNNWDPWLGPSFANNFAVNNFYGVGGGFVSNYYCPPSWGAGIPYNTVNVINNNNTNPNSTYYGPRNTDAVANPRTGAPRTRISSLEAPRAANPTVERTRTATTPVRDAGTERTRTYDTPPVRTAPASERTRTYDRPSYDTPPTRANPPSRYDAPTRTAPAPSRETAPAPRRETPMPSRSYDAPSRSYDTPSRNYNTTPSRSYDAPSRSTSPSSGSSATPSSGATRTRGN